MKSYYVTYRDDLQGKTHTMACLAKSPEEAKATVERMCSWQRPRVLLVEEKFVDKLKKSLWN